MENQPKKLITRILEFTALFALSAFLVRLGVSLILAVWPVLLILAAITAGVVIGYRVWQNRARW